MSTAAKVKGGTPVVEQVYLLDGTQLKRGADGSFPEAQFFCSLNKSVAEADFLISGLAPGTLWICDCGCDGYEFAVAVVVFAAAGRRAVDDGRVLSEAAVGGGP